MQTKLTYPKNVVQVLKLFHKNYPKSKYYLNFSNPLELMVAAILSAQVRDEVVNAATSALFKKYRTAEAFAKADVKDIIHYIKNITFAVNKAKHIKEACKILVEKHGGKVPKTLEELTELPGIGRKTANAILQNAFGIVNGIVVDTHVLRVSYRLGWTSSDKNAEKAEQELMEIIPKKEWQKLPHFLKDHGRAICRAPVPLCSKCFLSQICPKKGVMKKL